MTFILFIAVILLLIWIASLNSRLSDVERRLRSLGSVQPSILPSSVPKPPSFDMMPQPMHAEGYMQHQPMATAAAQSPVLPVKPEQDMESVFTTSWLNKIGVVALLLGMVFFFKYAVDQGWITPWLRVIIGFLVGGLLVYLGELWKEKYGSRAHALSGGGIALLYFTIFAAYQFYGLISQPLGFGLVLIIAAASVFLSFRYSSLTLGVLGFFGAYGAPIMISSGRDQQISLFSYLTILNIAAFIILARKYWLELLALALVGTTIDFALWGNTYSNSQNTFASLFFTIITATLYIVGLGLLTRYHHSKNSLPQSFGNNASAVSFLTGLFYFVASVLLLNQNYHSMLAPAMLLGGTIFLFTYALVDRLEFQLLNYVLSFAGAFFLFFAAGWQWHDKSLGLAWLALGLLGATIGALVKREELRTWSIVVLFLALFQSFVQPYTDVDQVFLFNAKFGLMFANTLGLLYAGWLFEKYPPKQALQNTQTILEVIAAVLLWIAVSWDIGASISGPSSLWHNEWITFWWIVFPSVLAFIGYASKRKFLLATAAVLIILGFMRTLVLPYADDIIFLFNAKFGLMLAECVSLLFIAHLYHKQEGQNQLSDIFKIGSALLLWFAVSWEIVELYQGSFSQNARNLSLSVWWIVYSVVLLIAGSVGKSPIFRKVALLLFGLSILKVFLYDVQALDTPYRVVAFIVLGVILLSVSFSYQRNKDKIAKFLEGEKGSTANPT